MRCNSAVLVLAQTGLTAFLTACAPAVPERPVVESAGSVYRGIQSETRGVAAFFGVPFAAAAGGAQRWREPQPPPPGLDVDASRFAAACMQGTHMVDWYRDLVADFGGEPDSFPVPEFSEDCLYLNIWSPSPKPDAALPVMVWIHGGSHRGGWSHEPNYIGDALAARGVVVVSIAYRLDIFGFFSHPDLPVANYGLLDQIAALRWVQSNIDRFGGDPGNVTVFGESAGASSISYLLAMPLAQGLFNKAIHQSAGYQLTTQDTREKFVAKGIELERRVLGGANAGGIDALREAAPQALLQAAAIVFADYQPDVVADGLTLPETVRNALDKGMLRTVDTIFGTNADEWLMYLEADSGDEDIDRRMSHYGIVRPDEVKKGLQTSDGTMRQLDRLVSGHEFVCPTLELARNTVAQGRSAWVYYFSRVRPGAHARFLGAYHGAEIPYVFDKHDDWLPGDEREDELTELMMELWVGFAKYGRPSASGVPDWVGYSADTQLALEIGDSVGTVTHPETALCAAMQAE